MRFLFGFLAGLVFGGLAGTFVTFAIFQNRIAKAGASMRPRTWF